MKLPEAFLRTMQQRLGEDFPAFLRSYDTPPKRGLRVNGLKISKEAFAARAPFPLGEGIPWEPNGFYLGEERAGADVYHAAGLYYLQEPSAMSAVPMLGVKGGERVLDLCAAPGGKTTQLASGMGGEGVLIAAEIDYGRACVLSQNVERMGIANCAVMNTSPDFLAERFTGYFDAILADAPCSGEGMFKKEPNAIPEWSPSAVQRCALRQSRILDRAAGMLAPGGRMVYSTCTFSEEEDGQQVECFLKRHPEFSLCGMKTLFPHEVAGEGHFCALLEKTDGETARPKPFPVRSDTRANRAFCDFAEDFFEESDFPLERITTGQINGMMYLVPADMPLLPGGMLRCGVELGAFDGKRFKPAHALAMAFGGRARRKLTLTREEAVRYLHGDAIAADLENGWCAVCAEEFPLGLGKCVNGLVKNHLPKGLRT